MELDELKNGHVTIGDASKIPIKSKGKSLIHFKNKRHQFISSVYFMSNMKNNTLSLSQLLEKYCDIHIKNQNLSIRYQHANLIVNVSMTRSRMFYLNIQNNVVKMSKNLSMIPLEFNT